MVSLQNYLENRYSIDEKKQLKEIDVHKINQEREKEGVNLANNKLEIEGGKLDLSEFIRLEILHIDGGYYPEKFQLSNKLICLSGISKSIKELIIPDNQLTNDILIIISELENLKKLDIGNNNLLGNISIFKNLNKLRKLEINDNRFYGSLESLKNMKELVELGIGNTDIDGGLEYLPLSLTSEESLFKYYSYKFDNFVDNLSKSNYEYETETKDYEEGKVKFIIQEILNFGDLKKWQLNNPEKMLIARPELFIDLETRRKWVMELEIRLNSAKLSFWERNLINEKLEIIYRFTQALENYEAEIKWLENNLKVSRPENFHTDQLSWYKNSRPEIFKELTEEKLEKLKNTEEKIITDKAKIKIELSEFIDFLTRKREEENQQFKNSQIKNQQLEKENEDLRQKLKEIKSKL